MMVAVAIFQISRKLSIELDEGHLKCLEFYTM